MKTIIEKIEGREWDWFGLERDEIGSMEPTNLGVWMEVFGSKRLYSLADLLTNKSWCMAVWGRRYKNLSTMAYAILRDEGHDACITYITRTMV